MSANKIDENLRRSFAAVRWKSERDCRIEVDEAKETIELRWTDPQGGRRGLGSVTICEEV